MPEFISRDDAMDEVFEKLGFCGCGMPSDAAEFIAKALAHIGHRCWDGPDFTYEDWKAEGDALFHNDGIAYFVYYVFDKLELTDHGGSVPGWLTDLGKDVLAKLEKLPAEEKPIEPTGPIIIVQGGEEI